MSWNIPQSFYDNLDPSYRDLFLTLEYNLRNANNDQKIELLNNFSANYMMPVEAWRMLIDCHPQHSDALKKEAQYKFFYEKPSAHPSNEPGIFTRAHCNILERNYFKDELDELFKLPNNYTEFIYLMYEKYSSSPLNKNRFDKMKQLQEHINSAKNDVEEWFNWIIKSENNKFIKVNIEKRLSKDLTNKKLWKLYMDYIKRRNSKEILHLYSKYCRFFIDDEQMKYKYRQRLITYGPISLLWRNLFAFEERLYKQESVSNKREPFSTQRFTESLRFQKRAVPQTRKRIFQKLQILQNIKNSTCPFKSPYVSYILSNANAAVLSKLHQTCKYFFIKRPILPCYRLVLSPPSPYDHLRHFVEDSLKYSPLASAPRAFESIRCGAKKFYIGTSLYANHPTNAKMLSAFIHFRIIKCDAKHIEIKNQKLKESEFDFLIGHGNVESCCLDGVKIMKDNGELIKLEEVLTKMPKLKYFSAYYSDFDENSTKDFSTLLFTNKILFWRIFNVTADFDAEIFCDFVKKNAAPSSSFGIQFRLEIHIALIMNFKEQVNEIQKKWHEPFPKPEIVFLN